MRNEFDNEEFEKTLAGFRDYRDRYRKVEPLRKEVEDLIYKMDMIVQGLNMQFKMHEATAKLCNTVMYDEMAIVHEAYKRKTHIHAGVYFLIKKYKIVYVGQSVNVIQRVRSHRSEGVKDFDAYNFILCKPEELNALESIYIHRFSPEHNQNVPIDFTSILASVSAHDKRRYEKNV